MARPCFKSERRAQSVRVVLFNERDSGVSAARAFLLSLSEPQDAAPGGPATAGRVNSYCRPSPGLPGIAGALAARRFSLQSPRPGGQLCSRHAPEVGFWRRGGPQAAMGRCLACKPLPTMRTKMGNTRPKSRRRVFRPLVRSPRGLRQAVAFARVLIVAGSRKKHAVRRDQAATCAAGIRIGLLHRLRRQLEQFCARCHRS